MRFCKRAKHADGDGTKTRFYFEKNEIRRLVEFLYIIICVLANGHF